MKKGTVHLQPGRLRLDSGHHRRIIVVMVLLGFVAFLPIGTQLYRLMISRYAYYAGKARQNQSRTTAVTADRGDIYDRNMNLLATSVGVENVYLDPQELKQSKANVEDIARVLGEILALEPQWISEQASDFTKRYKQLAANVSQETADEIRAYINHNGISGIHLEPSSQRIYPYSTLAAQVIGFTNASNTGSEGIEAAYNSYLEGTKGKVVTTKGNNEMDMPYSYENYVAAQKGNSLVLTLDTTVQACLENRLQEAIEKYDVQNGAFGIVMNVNTGEILAMATLDSYDPNNYQDIYNTDTAQALEEILNTKGTDAYQEALTAARLQQWRNRCISDGYEPGSTFKVLTLASALDSGSVSLHSSFNCAGAERIIGRSQLLHCWKSVGHGSQTTAQALQNSCNLAFAHIGLSMGGEIFYQYLQNFGIMNKTGIDLSGESSGVFFSKELLTDTDKWGTASLTSASFGQTFKLTPLQLVRAIAAVVNGGYLVEPYIVSEIFNADGNTVLKQETTVLRQVISEETSKTMCQLLQTVVAEGTAKNASVAGYSIGGKTGTSEKIDILDENGNPTLDKIVSFVGVAPMDDPEYIILVALDTPSRSTGLYISGGQMAAPTCGAVMADILPYLGVPQNYTEADAAGRVYVMEELTGLSVKDAQTILKEQGLKAEIIGEGDTVTGQIPAAGMEIAGDSEVLLYAGTALETETVTVPDFSGMDRTQALDAAEKAGVYILVAGNADISSTVLVTHQDISAGKEVEKGTLITLTFTDKTVAD